MDLAALIVWGAFLLGAALYVRRAAHPRRPALAAYLIFVTVLSVSAFALFALGSIALEAAGAVDRLRHPVGIAAFLAVVFVPASLLARWQMRQPPRQIEPM